MVELTSPWEENPNDWHFKKLRKYKKLEKAVEMNGWDAFPLYVESWRSGLHQQQMVYNEQNSRNVPLGK